jgi:hypothetical protein
MIKAEKGSNGSKGEKGNSGNKGQAGTKGEKGEPGTSGLKGSTGYFDELIQNKELNRRKFSSMNYLSTTK